MHRRESEGDTAKLSNAGALGVHCYSSRAPRVKLGQLASRMKMLSEISPALYGKPAKAHYVQRRLGPTNLTPCYLIS